MHVPAGVVRAFYPGGLGKYINGHPSSSIDPGGMVSTALWADTGGQGLSPIVASICDKPFAGDWRWRH